MGICVGIPIGRNYRGGIHLLQNCRPLYRRTGFQFAALRGLRGVDLLDPFAEIDDVVLEGFQQDVDRLLAGLLEMLGLLA